MAHLTLPVKLTDAELRDRAQTLGNRIHELALVEEKKKDSNSAFKAEADALEIEIRDLGRVVRTGSEDREVEVSESFDFLARLSRTIRLDTGDVVRSRPATVDEIREHEQPGLPFGQAKPPEDGATPPAPSDDEKAHAVSHEAAEVEGAKGGTVTPMPAAEVAMPDDGAGDPPAEGDDSPKKARKRKAAASA